MKACNRRRQVKAAFVNLMGWRLAETFGLDAEEAAEATYRIVAGAARECVRL